MTQAQELVPCYACGASQHSDQEACENCDAPFTRDCKCGAEVSIYESHCTVCFRARRRKPRKRGKWKLALVVLGMLGAAGVGLYLWDSGPAEIEAWRAKDDALLMYKRGEYGDALAVFERLTARTPRDPQVWYMAAACYSNLEGFDPKVYEPKLQNALELSPQFPEALSLMARAKHHNGDYASAKEYAERALATGAAEPEVRVLLAELEMGSEVPDLGRALQALEGAIAAKHDSPQLRLQLAELRLRMTPGLTASEMSEEARDAVRAAEEALAKVDPDEFGHLRHAVARARLMMASNRRDRIGEASSALARVSPAEAAAQSVPRWLRAQYRILRGKILFAQAGGSDYVEQFLVALEQDPRFETAAEIAGFLKHQGNEATAIDILTRAHTQSESESGGIQAVLAGLYLGRGELDKAAKAISSTSLSEGSSVPELQYLLIEGDVRLAQRRLEDARSAYVKAAVRQPTLLEPKLRLALLSISRPDRDGSRARGIEEQVKLLQKLEETHTNDPRLWRTLAQLYIGLGRSSDAIKAARAAENLAPGDAVTLRTLGDAYLLSEENKALEQAAEYYERAVNARPFETSLVAAAARTRLELGQQSQALVTCTQYLDRAEQKAAEIVRLRLECHRRAGSWAAAAADLQLLLQQADVDRPALILETVETLFKAGLRREARALAAKSRPDLDADLQRRLDFLVGQYEGGEQESIRHVREQGSTLLGAQTHLALGERDQALGQLRELVQAEAIDYPAIRLLAMALLDCDSTDTASISEARKLGEELDAAAPAGLRDLVLGGALLAEGKPAAALPALRGAAEIRGRDPIARFLFGRALFETGDRSEALVELRAATLIPGAPPSVRTVVADCLLRASLEEESPRRAEMLITESLRLDDQNARAHLQYSALLHARGKHDESAQSAERGLGLAGVTPDLGVALRYRALVARSKTSELQKAMLHLDALPPVDRKDPRDLAARGFAYLAVRRDRDAQTSFESARALDPAEPLALLGTVRLALEDRRKDDAVDLVIAWQKRHPTLLDPPNAAARMLVERDEIELALEIVRACHDAVPTDLQTTQNLVRLLGRSGRAEEALSVAQRFAADAGPETRPHAKLLLGRTELRLALDPEAALALAQSVRLGAGAGEDAVVLAARTLEAEALLAQRRVDDAITLADELAQNWPAGAQYFSADRDLLARIWFVRGVARIERGLFADAAELLAECVDVTPDDPNALNNLAWALAKSGGAPRRAVEFARRATELRPGDPSVWDTHALCAGLASEFDLAEASWKRAIELFAAVPGADGRARARASISLAELYLKQGRKTEGRELLGAVASYAQRTPEADRAAQALRGAK